MSSVELAAFIAVLTAASTGVILKLLEFWLARGNRVAAGRVDLRTEIEGQQKRIDALWTRNDILEKKLGETDARYMVLQTANETLILELRALRGRIVVVTEEFREQLEKATQTLRDKLLAALQDAQSLRDQLRTATAEVIDLQKQLRVTLRKDREEP